MSPSLPGIFNLENAMVVGGGEGALADDARCHAESEEDRRLEQDGTAYEALQLTASSLAAASEGPVRWRRQGEAEPTGV